jgi:hypothetical protein
VTLEYLRHAPILIALLSFAFLALGCGPRAEPTPSGHGQIMAVNETAAVNGLRAITTAETAYQATNGSFGTLKQMSDSQTLDSRLAGGEKNGYRFDVRVNSTTGYEAVAVPVQYNFTGLRSFYLDSSGLIRGGDKKGAEATAADPAVQ